jgi:hypothetical protein
MDLSTLKKLVARALDAKQGEICAHIEKVQNEGHSGGIEAAFAEAFEAELLCIKIEREQPLSVIKTHSYYPHPKTGRYLEGGRLDCYLPEKGTAFEYKAVRLPRRHSDNVGGALYDIGQLASDYLRLNRAGKLKFGYVIAFVYGPLVLDAQSPGKLYRAFHNQMFVDFSVAKDDNQEDLTRHRRQAGRDLTWDSAYGSGRPPTRVGVVKVGRLGAICINCRV